ncbi:VanZ family protein [Snodgrassella alvi]|uniref:VanZ family protein n=1 Tax=Snodgrassella alvi TaxID=1196083 RepID=UPI000C1F0087|nr:VanZ family protein [Snodgrassella alvi]PIT15750.1 hypothetical protein BGI34_11105 [Snodgrassella alvi]PIT18901.1 hypothetical protein BGI33_00030 [Snodgrassella alvi]
MKIAYLNKWLLLATCWFIASIYFLFFKAGGNPVPIPQFDKICHFGLFFGQFWLLAKAYFSANITIPQRLFIITAIIWAAASETIQALFTTREGDIMDAIADLIGAALALWLAQQIQTARRNSNSNSNREKY